MPEWFRPCLIYSTYASICAGRITRAGRSRRSRRSVWPLCCIYYRSCDRLACGLTCHNSSIWQYSTYFFIAVSCACTWPDIYLAWLSAYLLPSVKPTASDITIIIAIFLSLFLFIFILLVILLTPFYIYFILVFYNTISILA